MFSLVCLCLSVDLLDLFMRMDVIKNAYPYNRGRKCSSWNVHHVKKRICCVPEVTLHLCLVFNGKLGNGGVVASISL